jgi:hypothetical protein
MYDGGHGGTKTRPDVTGRRRLCLRYSARGGRTDGRNSQTRGDLVLGCSRIRRLAGADEDRILARLRALRSDLIDPTIAVHMGRVVGDGSIVEFRSVVDAVRCAIEVQNAIIEHRKQESPAGTLPGVLADYGPQTVTDLARSLG